MMGETTERKSAMTFQDNDLVRVKKTGEVGRLTEINPTVPKPEDEYWALVVTQFRHVEIDSPDEIESYQRPSIDATDVAAAVSSAIHGGVGDLSVSETSVEGDKVTVFAEFRGLPISFVLSISEVEDELLT